MATIINQGISGPSGDILASFKNGQCSRILIKQGENIYRIVTNGESNCVEGAFWVDRDSFNDICSCVEYSSPLTSFTNIARNKVALTTKFSRLANGLICVSLNADIYAWKGKAEMQYEIMKNGIRVKYPGGLNQLWIPNITARVANYSFFHSL